MRAAPYVAAAASALGTVAALAFVGGWDGAIAGLEWTAACSAVAFAATRLVDEPSAWRRWWGALAASHAVHLVMILWFVVGQGGRPSVVALGIGGAGYLALAFGAARVLAGGADRADPAVDLASFVLWGVFTATYASHAAERGGRRTVAVVALVLLPLVRRFLAAGALPRARSPRIE